MQSARIRRERLRVAVSCNHCRVRKVKCDGKQPCSNCVAQPDACIYKNGQAKGSGSGTLEKQALQDRVDRLENLVRRMADQMALKNDTPAPIQPSHSSLAAGEGQASQVAEYEEENITIVDRLLEAAEADEDGSWSYQGNLSSQSFVRCVQDIVGSSIGESTPREMSTWAGPLRQALESASDDHTVRRMPLPPWHDAQELLSNPLDEGCALFAFIHRPSFDSMVRRLYEKPMHAYEKQERAFMPQFFAALALGSVCQAFTISSPEKRASLNEGARYFIAAKHLLDIPNCRSLVSLQALLLLSLFCLHHAQASETYAYCSLALRCALQMGLHRDLPLKAPPVELESRRRTFFTIKKLEIYIGAILGLPLSLQDEDVDQLLPAEVEDEQVTDAGIHQPAVVSTRMAIANAHTRLVHIMPGIHGLTPQVIRDSTPDPRVGVRFKVSEKALRKVEEQMQQWSKSLPKELWPGNDPSLGHLEKLRYLLRLAFSYYQIILYRPFMRYICQPFRQRADKRCVACAVACIRVSKGAIAIVQGMQQRQLLRFEEALPVSATYFAIMALSSYIISNNAAERVQELIADAEMGRELLRSMSRHSLWGDRCFRNLKAVFDKFPTRATGRGNADVERPIGSLQEAPDSAQAIPQGSSSLEAPQSVLPGQQHGNYDISRRTGSARATNELPSALKILPDSFSTPEIPMHPTLDIGIDAIMSSTQQLQYPFETPPSLDVPMAPGVPDGVSAFGSYSPQSNDSMDVFELFTANDPYENPLFSMPAPDEEMQYTFGFTESLAVQSGP